VGVRTGADGAVDANARTGSAALALDAAHAIAIAQAMTTTNARATRGRSTKAVSETGVPTFRGFRAIATDGLGRAEGFHGSSGRRHWCR
jgi:hypothetical protein